MALTTTSSLVAGKADYLTGHLGERGQSTRRRRHGNGRACAEDLRGRGQWDMSEMAAIEEQAILEPLTPKPGRNSIQPCDCRADIVRGNVA